MFNASTDKSRMKTDTNKMAGNINHFEKCLKSFKNDVFQVEMDDMASTKDTCMSLSQQKESPYIQNETNSQGSVLSLKLDTQPLTEPHACIYEECMKFHSPTQSDPESPASPMKNAFFYLVLILLVIWVVVYTVLSKLNYL